MSGLSNSENTPIGDRMKGQYENRTRYSLPRRTYTLVRVDGKAFHSFTRGCDRPFDYKLMDAMDATALFLCKEIQGAKFAFVQSDEVSVLLTDFATITTDAWFDGNVQKMASISASLATVGFNNAFGSTTALFDSRVWTIPDPVEVGNYFVWRQQDATRNSIQMAAQSMFSHKQLDKVTCPMAQEMMHQQKGVNWNDYPVGAKRGRVIAYREQAWVREEPPVFTQERNYLDELIPQIERRGGG